MGKWRALTIDLDKGVDAERFDALLSHSMESKQKIQQSMLSSVVSQIQPNYDSNQNIPWFYPWAHETAQIHQVGKYVLNA